MYRNQAVSGSILILDDEPSLRERLQQFLRKRGYRVSVSADSLEALERIAQERFDLILVDASAPGQGGVQVIQEIKSSCVDAAFVVMSAYATVDQSVQALRLGAADYVTKPFELYEVGTVIDRVILSRRGSNAQSGQSVTGDNNGRKQGQDKGLEPGLKVKIGQGVSGSFGKSTQALVGSSRAMTKVFAVIDRIAPTDSSVLITGATGTGKELVALAIHERSRRAKGTFVDINCSAIPDTLVEAELFGHQRGTFTGAHETRRGLFEQASGGTIFLDEIDALNPSAQAKLLRVIQERTLRRVGGRENIPIDVRIISATNGDLMGAIAKERFRADLLFRLRVVPLHLPLLRERDNDVALLIDYFLARHSERCETKPRRFSAEAFKALIEHPWPGNVRELENAVEYALAIGLREELGIEDLPPEFSEESQQTRDTLKNDASADNLPLIEVERRHIIKILEQFGGHQIKTATALGIDRRTLYRKLKQYAS
ncbi:MAG TPA: sigma-54 dependent transcriptional regulator [Pyrinomonadaceae bacterium]